MDDAFAIPGLITHIVSTLSPGTGLITDISWSPQEIAKMGWQRSLILALMPKGTVNMSRVLAKDQFMGRGEQNDCSFYFTLFLNLYLAFNQTLTVQLSTFFNSTKKTVASNKDSSFLFFMPSNYIVHIISNALKNKPST